MLNLPTYTRKSTIDELDLELQMRRRVWRINKDGRFPKPEHDKRYDKMTVLRDILKKMTDGEFNRFYGRTIPSQEPKTLFE